VDDILLFNKFFSDCFFPIVDMPYLRRHNPIKLCYGAQMANFCVLYFQRTAHFDLHSEFALRPHHVWKYGKHQSVTAGNRRGKKKEEETT